MTTLNYSKNDSDSTLHNLKWQHFKWLYWELIDYLYLIWPMVIYLDTILEYVYKTEKIILSFDPVTLPFGFLARGGEQLIYSNINTQEIFFIILVHEVISNFIM